MRITFFDLLQQAPDDDPDYLTPKEVEAAEQARKEEKNGLLTSLKEVER